MNVEIVEELVTGCVDRSLGIWRLTASRLEVDGVAVVAIVPANVASGGFDIRLTVERYGDVGRRIARAFGFTSGSSDVPSLRSVADWCLRHPEVIGDRPSRRQVLPREEVTSGYIRSCRRHRGTEFARQERAAFAEMVREAAASRAAVNPIFR